MKVIINVCFGGFGLSTAAYERLIELGVPVRKYVQQVRGPDGLYDRPPENEGEVIFDCELTPEGESGTNDLYWKYRGKIKDRRYWDTWTRGARNHPLLLRVVEELGPAANGAHADLKIVEIPDGIEYEISEYDGREHIAEKHRVWG